MLSNIQKSIILKATVIRMEKGELPEDILASYPKLTKAEQTELLNLLSKEQ